ncbi:type 1 glutamine amidotransferase [Roseococcus sp. SDR]|uniref:type 1 glutamine amidotransferase n=1 Tax=Roseococcus sp. SDR TaxID=2835532 RepID=UPI001BCB6BC1|nr:type 1 glutamine amidotransferase [Roseococcus sp. SDR]MBS7791564.1 type 1 glutamine amidotransferase [Roseococcus sp. SDR]MBV1846878.1 type 1 glutamine amidotransferase [Roseococcus sp. SDR]
MRIGILQCGEIPEALIPAHGSMGGMMRRLLPPGRDATLHDVTTALPESPTACDAWLVTGSAAGVYDDLPWIAPLKQFLVAARGRAKLVGICFGHQVMAEAFGGRVVKSDKGWGIGLHRYAVTAPAPWMDGAAPIRIAASHQDQVVAAPPGARVTLASDFTPLAGLDYGDAISFQCHPEFTADFSIALLEGRREMHGAAGEAAIESLRIPDDAPRMRGWIARFLEG